MLTFREGLSQADTEALVDRLASRYSVRKMALVTEGAIPAAIVEGEAPAIQRLSRDRRIVSMERIAPHGRLADQTIPPSKVWEAPPGWAIPGRYLVALAPESAGFASPWSVGVSKASKEDLDREKAATVARIAKELVQRHGGRITSNYAPLQLAFICAMNERQARAMAQDPRVVYVAEDTYAVLE